MGEMKGRRGREDVNGRTQEGGGGRGREGRGREGGGGRREN